MTAGLVLTGDTLSPVRDARTIRLRGTDCQHRIDVVVEPAAGGDWWLAAVIDAHDLLHDEGES